MSFSSPQWLALLGLVPLFVVGYVMRMRRRAAARPLAEPHLVAALVPRRPGWRQHVPAAALAVAASAGLVAFAGPTATVADRRDAATLLVALDVSGSMKQTDVVPDRLGAAKSAADAFIGRLPDHVDVGVVEFSGTAGVVIPPTQAHDEVRSVLQGLQPRSSTAIGEGVYAGLDALTGVPSGEDGTPSGTDEPVAPRRIILLSDGANTAGRPIEQAAAAAAAAGVPVDTIAFGTEEAAAADPQGAVDRDALQALAQTTGGRAYEATSAEELQQAYQQIGSQSIVEPVRRSVADWLLGAALIAALGGAAAALTWFRRLPV